MICKDIKTKLLYNYNFVDDDKTVEIWDGENDTKKISYDEWCKGFCIIDKWRCLSPEEIEYNKQL